MQIYFGSEPLDQIHSLEGMLVTDNAPEHAFYYGVEMGSNVGGLEEVLIYDGIDREVPIDIESVPSLIAALETMLKLHSATKAAEEIMDVLYDCEQEAYVIREESV